MATEYATQNLEALGVANRGPDICSLSDGEHTLDRECDVGRNDL